MIGVPINMTYIVRGCARASVIYKMAFVMHKRAGNADNMAQPGGFVPVISRCRGVELASCQFVS